MHAMAGKKIIKKGKKGGKIVPGDGEKGSPKVSPKTSPKLPPKESPKTSPKLSPKEAKKAKKAAAKAKPDAPAEAKTTGNATPNKPGTLQKAPPTTQEKEKATTEVIRIIKEALKNPEAQKKGVAWTPKDWPTKWKPILGGYRKFVERCACFQVVPSPSIPANWTISVVEGAAEGAMTKAKWEIELQKAYGSFSQTNQDPKEFTQLAQALASAPKPESAPKGEKRKAEAPAKSEAKKKAKNKMKAKKGKGGEA